MSEDLNQLNDRALNNLAVKYPPDDVFGQLIRDEIGRRHSSRVAKYAYISAVAAAVSAIGSMLAAVAALVATLAHK